MIGKRNNRLLILVVAILFIPWWFYGADWLAKPHTYRAGVVFICSVIITMSFHIRAYYRFHRMVKILRLEEKVGSAEPGSALFAGNQSFRYLSRTIESFVVLLVGVLAVIAVRHPGLILHPAYTRLILTYFIGSIILTGYLTLRDLWVINHIRNLSETHEDAAELHPAKVASRTAQKKIR